MFCLPYGINEERQLAELVARDVISMNELVGDEIKNEYFWWTNLR